jgi:hypothetical protein
MTAKKKPAAPVLPKDTIKATHAEEIKNQPNELLEVHHGGETLDSRATGAAIQKNKELAALE